MWQVNKHNDCPITGPGKEHNGQNLGINGSKFLSDKPEVPKITVH